MRVDGEDDIYAVGECAQHRGQVYGLVAPLWEQATVLAEHLTGRNQQAAYHGSKLATKLKVSGRRAGDDGPRRARASRRRGRAVLRAARAASTSR